MTDTDQVEAATEDGVLEPDAVVLRVLRQQPLVRLLELSDPALQPLDREPLPVLRSSERAPRSLDLLAEVVLHQLAAEGQPGEA